jgi:hypothetical protein
MVPTGSITILAQLPRDAADIIEGGQGVLIFS